MWGEEQGQTPQDTIPPPSQKPGGRMSGIPGEVAAAQRTCQIMEQGEQAKACMEQHQASSVATIQPSKRAEEKQHTALVLSEVPAAP